MKNGPLEYLDRLGEPFLFLEERLVRMGPGKVDLAINTLPKVVFVLEGTMSVDFEGERSSLLRPGSVLVNFRHLRQTYRPPSLGQNGQMRVLRLTFPWEKFDRKAGKDDFTAFLRSGLPPFGVLQIPGRLPWDRSLQQARTQLSSRHPDRRLRAHAALRLALLDITQSWQNAVPRENGEADMAGRLQERINHYIEEHLDKPISLADIAAAVDRSEEHVSRIYRQRQGTALFDEIRRLRIDRAKYFLLCTDLSITRIAEKSGFATLAHFSRTFKEGTGKNPQRFREEK